MQERKDELTSCRAARGTGMTVLTYPCPSQPCFGGSKGCARVTGKAGENGQYSGAGRQLTLDKTVGSRVW